MKKNMKMVALALSVCVLLGVLSGCGMFFSATDLVQGNLDLIYRNEYTDEYLASVDLTADEADGQYEEGVQVEADYFAYYFDIYLEYCDESYRDRIEDLYHEIYAHSKYEVGEQTQNGDTYLVELTVYPIDIIWNVVEEDTDAFMEDWQARGEAGEFDEYTDQEFEEAWADGIIRLVEDRLDDIGYLEPEVISVQITPDDDGVYSISDNDFQRIDSLIIAY